MKKFHSFHIPVMGLAFTIDTPVKVAHFGVDSVIPLADDALIENMRKHYCEKYNFPYSEITDKEEDYRAKRVRAYLDTVKKIAEENFHQVIESASEMGAKIKRYFSMLPDIEIKKEFAKLTEKMPSKEEILDFVRKNLQQGSIDVNIMTKVDKDNYKGKEKLPVEFNDAHAALRGFAESELESSVILSAGFNPRLYGYIENFDCFFPDVNGNLRKKIILKVSDYRSALIQGKFLAKKGIWISEFRIESGLNCGGHAFASDGYLMGPILAEFRDHRDELTSTLFDVLVQGLTDKGRPVPATPPAMRVTAQGGVGTAEEHDFLLKYYKLDAVGWGSPFLLVPEATILDDYTRNLVKESTEKDLYLSGISPLGVPFNSLRNNSKDLDKEKKAAAGKPGSPCTKKHLSFSNEFSEIPICTASRLYQHKKIKLLKEQGLSENEFKKAYDKVVEKACICTGLSTPAYIEHGFDTGTDGNGVSVCPGPNIAYFTDIMRLEDITDHIYGRANWMKREDRPHVFVKELQLYLSYFENQIKEASEDFSAKKQKYLILFADNLKKGIEYYQGLFEHECKFFAEIRTSAKKQLDDAVLVLETLKSRAEELVLVTK